MSNVEITHLKVKFKEEFSVIKYFAFRGRKAETDTKKLNKNSSKKQ